MLGGLIKPAWESEDASKRLRAIQKLDPQNLENQAILFELAQNDSSKEVRFAALDQIGDAVLLFKISNSHADTPTRQHAEIAFRNLVCDGNKLNAAACENLISVHSELSPMIAALTPHHELRQKLLKGLADSELANILALAHHTETRQEIADKLNDIEALQLARRTLKGRDKNAEKIIISKIDAHNEQARKNAELLKEASFVCDKMEYLAEHDWQPEFKAKYNIWNERWQALEPTPEGELAQRYVTASTRVAQNLEQARHLDDALEGQVNLNKKLRAYCRRLAPLSWSELFAEASSINSIINSSAISWAAFGDIRSAPTDQTEKFVAKQKSLSSLSKLCESNLFTEAEETKTPTTEDLNKLDVAISAIRWSAKLPKLVAIDEAKARLAELRQQLYDQSQASSDKLDKLHKRINRLLGSTKRGDLKRAKGELAALRKAAEHYSGKDRASLDDRLEQADTALSKMGDWKDFATEPKFLALCEAMEKLVGSKNHPDALATIITKVQNDWKALGHSESADQHWPRFKAAADKAYEPCAKFFAERHATRKKNLQRREPYVSQMQHLLEATEWEEQPDYKSIERELQNIMNVWRKIKDVERGPGEKQWQRLKTYRSKIDAKINPVYDANIERKKQIIEQARALLNSEINEDALKKIQLFQSRWKQVGITRRKQDQTAWKQFKSTTDDIYAKIQRLRKDKRAEEDAQLEGYRSIIREIQDLAKSANTLSEADAAFENLQTSYSQLPELPRNLPEKLVLGIEKDFQRAGSTFSQARERIIENEQQATMEALQKKAALCAELEQTESTKELEEICEKINRIEISVKDLQQRIESRIQNALDLQRRSSVQTEAQEIRRKLCLDLEILLDVESPTEDRGHRMQIQLERLQQSGIGHAPQDTFDDLSQLQLDWLCLPGAGAKAQSALEARFQHALSAHKKTMNKK